MDSRVSRVHLRASLCDQGEAGVMHDAIVRSAPEALEWSSWHDSPMDQIKPADQQWPHNVTSPNKRSARWVSSKLDPVAAYSHVNCVLWSHYQWHRFMHARGGLCFATQSPLIYETQACACFRASVLLIFFLSYLQFRLFQHTENNDHIRSAVWSAHVDHLAAPYMFSLAMQKQTWYIKKRIACAAWWLSVCR